MARTLKSWAQAGGNYSVIEVIDGATNKRTSWGVWDCESDSMVAYRSTKKAAQAEAKARYAADCERARQQYSK